MCCVLRGEYRGAKYLRCGIGRRCRVWARSISAYYLQNPHASRRSRKYPRFRFLKLGVQFETPPGQAPSFSPWVHRSIKHFSPRSGRLPHLPIVLLRYELLTARVTRRRYYILGARQQCATSSDEAATRSTFAPHQCACVPCDLRPRRRKSFRVALSYRSNFPQCLHLLRR